MAINEEKMNQLIGRFLDDFGATFHAAMVVIGDKLDLYKTLAAAGPLTSQELADRTGTTERYVREWLASQAAGGYVNYEGATGLYSLSEEQAFALADESSPAFLPGAFQLAVSAVKSVEAKLSAGARVADVGCGHGASTILMAKAFPKSTFVGFDYHGQSIEYARTAASDAGVSDRVTFEVAKAKEYPGQDYDFVTFFDCLHDMGDPVGASAHVLQSLKSDGTWLLVEPFAGDKLEDNFNPVGRAFYGASTLLCTPASLSQEVGLGLGAQAGEARLREVVTSGGFTRFRRAAQTPFNLVFEARP